MDRPAAVLFDFGSTLFCHDDLPATIARAAARAGVAASPDEVWRVAHAINDAAMRPQELAAHPRDLDAEVWQARWRALYALADTLGAGAGDQVYRSMHDPGEWHPYPATTAVLAGLHERGVPVGVISNTGWDVRAPFAVRGLLPFVTSFTLSYEAGTAKPSREIFELACATLGTPAEEVLMVGDDPVADAGAVRCGMRALLLPSRPRGVDNGLGAVLDLVTGPQRSARDRAHGVH